MSISRRQNTLDLATEDLIGRKVETTTGLTGVVKYAHPNGDYSIQFDDCVGVFFATPKEVKRWLIPVEQ